MSIQWMIAIFQISIVHIDYENPSKLPWWWKWHSCCLGVDLTTIQFVQKDWVVLQTHVSFRETCSQSIIRFWYLLFFKLNIYKGVISTTRKRFKASPLLLSIQVWSWIPLSHQSWKHHKEFQESQKFVIESVIFFKSDVSAFGKIRINKQK